MGLSMLTRFCLTIRVLRRIQRESFCGGSIQGHLGVNSTFFRFLLTGVSIRRRWRELESFLVWTRAALDLSIAIHTVLAVLGFPAGIGKMVVGLLIIMARTIGLKNRYMFRTLIAQEKMMAG